MLTAFILKLCTPHIPVILPFACHSAGEKVYFLPSPSPPRGNPVFLEARLVLTEDLMELMFSGDSQTSKQTNRHMQTFLGGVLSFFFSFIYSIPGLQQNHYQHIHQKNIWASSFWGLQNSLQALHMAYKRILPVV